MAKGNPRKWIIKFARQYKIDPAAALAVASTEGGIRWGAVGDSGTSFGPFQLHRGGALPAGKGAAWANSPAGIEYAIRQMAKVGAAGKTGKAAITEIVRDFERPADVSGQIGKAWGRYSDYSSNLDIPPSPASTPADAANPAHAHDTSTSAVDIGSARTELINTIMGNNTRFMQGEMINPMDTIKAFQKFNMATAASEAMADPVTTDQDGNPARTRDRYGRTVMRNGREGYLLPTDIPKVTHQTSGLDGYPAYDFMMADGTPVFASFGGTVTRVSGHAGGTAGGAAGRSYYIQTRQGNKLFLTHFDWEGKGKYGQVLLKQGQQIKPGQLLGYAMSYPGGAHHIHYGINK